MRPNQPPACAWPSANDEAMLTAVSSARDWAYTYQCSRPVTHRVCEDGNGCTIHLPLQILRPQPLYRPRDNVCRSGCRTSASSPNRCCGDDASRIRPMAPEPGIHKLSHTCIAESTRVRYQSTAGRGFSWPRHHAPTMLQCKPCLFSWGWPCI